MKKRTFFKSIILATALLPLSILAKEKSRSDILLEQLKDPNCKKVFVVAHRGDWRNACENSLQAIKNCIDMGVDIVEIDVQSTKDGVLILNHDGNFKRTCAIVNPREAYKNLPQKGEGKVNDYTYEEIQKYFTLRDGAGSRTPWKVPTLKEAMTLAKGKILVNIDKGFPHINKVQKILKETGTENQVIYKGGAPYAKVRQMYGDLLDKIVYMPITGDSSKHFSSFIDDFIANYRPLAFEVLYRSENSPMLDKIKELKKQKIKVWVNTLWPGMQAGHSDEYAYLDPDAHWGWVIRHGADIMQTDRPEAMLKYLRTKGLHE